METPQCHLKPNLTFAITHLKKNHSSGRFESYCELIHRIECKIDQLETVHFKMGYLGIPVVKLQCWIEIIYQGPSQGF